MKREGLFLGVDGGGTKTATAIVDSRNRRLALAEGPPSLRTGSSWKPSLAALRATVLLAERQTKLRRPTFVASCFALAGVDAPKDATQLRSLIRNGFGSRVGRLLVVNDTRAALRAGTDQDHAAVVVAGTGSNCLAVGPKGEAFAGGFGWILGDDGGGFWIGRAALRAVLRDLDGRGPATRLTRGILRATGARDAASLHERVSLWETPKRSVSLLSRVVDDAARGGDRTARAILQEAGERLASMANAAARRAGLGRSAFPLVLSGGTFRSVDVEYSLRRTLRRTLPNAQPVRLRLAPAWGAAWLARDLVVRKN